MRPKIFLVGEFDADFLKSHLKYDRDTGVFTWADTGKVAGSLRNGYTVINIETFAPAKRAHRLAWLYVYGKWPTGDIDHINGERSDNRIENLRDVTRAINIQNRRKASAGSKSGLLGVVARTRGKPWGASIRVDGKNKYLGTWDTKEQAHEAYLIAKRKYHPGCTI